jgi:hypothetical protein
VSRKSDTESKRQMRSMDIIQRWSTHFTDWFFTALKRVLMEPDMEDMISSDRDF